MRSILKVLLFSTLAVLVLVVVFFSLLYTLEPKIPSQTPVMVQGSSNGLQLTMTLEKTDYSLGEPINMAFTITNISNQTITIMQYEGDRFDFRVYNDSNNSVYQRSQDYHVNPGGPIIVSTPQGSQVGPVIDWTALNVEESLTGAVIWDQIYNSTAFSEGGLVSSGTYHIVGQISMFSGLDGLTIETTPVKIVIA